MMNTNRQIFFHAIAARRAILRREMRSNFYQLFIGTFSLIFQLLEEITNRNVVHLFAQNPSRQSENGKFFNRYQVIRFNQMGRNFVPEIVSLVCDFLMNLFELQNRFTSPVRTFFLSRNRSLSNSQFLLGLFEVFEIVYLCAVRECQETTDSSVKTNGFACFRQRCNVRFNREDCKPFAAFVLNCESFNFTLNDSGKFNFDGADFRERQLVSRQRKTALRKAKAIEAVLSFEARKTSLTFFSATKERLESFVQSFQNVLQNLRVNIFVFGIGSLNFGKLVGLVVVIQRNAIQLVSISAFRERGIIDVSTQIESLFKIRLDNFRGFADAKLVGFLYDVISDFYYYRNDCLQGKQVVTATCLPVSNYTKHSHFSQSRILIYVEETIAEKRDCCGTRYISDQICQRIKLWSESCANS